MRRKKKALHRNYSFINVHPIAGALGAEIKGVNISLPLKREVVLEIRQALPRPSGDLLSESGTHPSGTACLLQTVWTANGIPTVEGTARMSDDHRGNQAGV